MSKAKAGAVMRVLRECKVLNPTRNTVADLTISESMDGKRIGLRFGDMAWTGSRSRACKALGILLGL
jgi:hypothetical protein